MVWITGEEEGLQVRWGGGGMNYMIEKEIVEEKLKEFEEAQARQLPNNYSSSGSNLGGSD